MSKKRKTRKEKELSRLRREVQIQRIPDPMNVSYSVSSIKPKEKKDKSVVTPPNQQGTGFIKNHEYVMHDVKHTLIASGILVVLYAVLFIFKDYFFSLLIR